MPQDGSRHVTREKILHMLISSEQLEVAATPLHVLLLLISVHPDLEVIHRKALIALPDIEDTRAGALP